jgi:hypothetical protein
MDMVNKEKVLPCLSNLKFLLSLREENVQYLGKKEGQLQSANFHLQQETFDLRLPHTVHVL